MVKIGSVIFNSDQHKLFGHCVIIILIDSGKKTIVFSIFTSFKYSKKDQIPLVTRLCPFVRDYWLLVNGCLF